MPRSDVSYLAGILDGEGYIGICRKSTGAYLATIQVGVTSRPLVDHLHKSFGGFVTKGKVEANCEMVFQWCVAARPLLREILPAVIPELIVKRLNAVLVYEFCCRFSPGKGHYLSDSDRVEMEKYHRLSSILNSRGPGSAANKAAILKLVTVSEVPSEEATVKTST